MIMDKGYKIRDQDQPYFITFTVVGWIDVFTRGQYCVLLIESLKYCQRENGLVIYAWCIMSTHMHLIVGRNKESKLEAIIRDFKKFSSLQICSHIEENKTDCRREFMLAYFKKAATESKKHTKYMFWQAEYHPVQLSTNTMMKQRLNYIHNNPVKAGIVEKAEDYIYSSAKVYYLNVPGLLEIEFIC
jgi:putative transposase